MLNHYEFEADGVCIDSDVLHTACVTKGELLICLFDKTSLFAALCVGLFLEKREEERR